MDDEQSTDGIDRRSFLKGAAVAGVGAVIAANSAAAADAKPEAGAGDANRQGNKFITRPGSDFMVDVLKSLDIPYVASCAASSFRSLHESIVNYGGNKKPEFLTCLHEEISAGIAHGYYKASGKMLAIAAHGTVGLQHAAMGVYNAWCDRVPMLVIGGNAVDAARRRPGVEWYHCMQDPAAQFRDYTKWDDQPASLQHFAESTVRAYRMAMSPPTAPVMISCDLDLQEDPIHDANLTIPSAAPPSPPVAEAEALRAAAKMLVAAQNPLIVADRAVRNQDGVAALVRLAETLQCPVIDLGGRMNFPSSHYLCQSGNRATLVRNADVILMLEVADPWNILNGWGDPWKVARRTAKPDVKVIHITLAEFLMKSNYQDMQRYQPATIGISADAHASLTPLLDAVKRELTASRAAEMAGKADGLRKGHQAMRERAHVEAHYGWDASPITTARLATETYEAVKNEKWSLVCGETFSWPRRLWPTTEYHNMLGHSGGYGVGYNAPASVGAALANKERGIFTVSIQPDGDLLMAPSVLWTAAHFKIPLLIVMANNRAYAQEVMHLQRMANLHQRDPRTARIGNVFDDPAIQYASIAQGYGVWAEGPVTEPAQLAPALQRALKVVKGGAPALLDVVCQMR